MTARRWYAVVVHDRQNPERAKTVHAFSSPTSRDRFVALTPGAWTVSRREAASVLGNTWGLVGVGSGARDFAGLSQLPVGGVQ